MQVSSLTAPAYDGKTMKTLLLVTLTTPHSQALHKGIY